MEFDKKNIDVLIEEKFLNFSSNREKLSETWKININKTTKGHLKFHQDLGGLIEPAYKLEMKFKKGNFINYLKHPLRFIRSVIKSIYNNHLNKIIEETDARFINELQVKTPDFKNSSNGFYKNINGKCYNNNIRKYSQHYLFLKNYIDFSSISIYCEIGAGFGGMIELLTLNTNIKKYIIIDLNETLIVSMKYLAESINDDFKFIYVESEKDLTKAQNGKVIYFISTLFYNKLKSQILKNFKIDLFFNSHSFSEMKKEIFEDYISFIEKNNDCYLCSINQLNRNKDLSSLSAEDFIFDKKWKLIKKFVLNPNVDLNEFFLHKDEVAIMER